jgi:hypothetical protein
MDEIFRCWAESDYADTARALGYPSVSPTFRALGAPCDELEPFELTPQERAAIMDGMAWLASNQPAIFSAVGRRYKRWIFGRPLPGDEELLASASETMEKILKEALG